MSPKTVLITGCSEGGIGDALAQLFHHRGLRVFATARNLAKVQHLEKIGMTILQLDVADASSRKRAAEYVKEATGGTLDILVNNAGVMYAMPILDVDLDVARQTYEVNTLGLVGTTQAFAPLVIAAKGRIVNIGSVASIMPVPWQGIYASSKAAVRHLSDNMRLELAPFDVKVILVVTGSIETNIYQNGAERCKLPESSVYKVSHEKIESSMLGDYNKTINTPVEKYAESVVTNALKSRPRLYHWTGAKSFNIWACATFGWSTVWDVFLPDIYCISDFAKAWLAKG